MRPTPPAPPQTEVRAREQSPLQRSTGSRLCALTTVAEARRPERSGSGSPNRTPHPFEKRMKDHKTRWHLPPVLTARDQAALSALDARVAAALHRGILVAGAAGVRPRRRKIMPARPANAPILTWSAAASSCACAAGGACASSSTSSASWSGLSSKGWTCGHHRGGAEPGEGWTLRSHSGEREMAR